MQSTGLVADRLRRNRKGDVLAQSSLQVVFYTSNKTYLVKALGFDSCVELPHVLPAEKPGYLGILDLTWQTKAERKIERAGDRDFKLILSSNLWQSAVACKVTSGSRVFSVDASWLSPGRSTRSLHVAEMSELTN